MRSRNTDAKPRADKVQVLTIKVVESGGVPDRRRRTLAAVCENGCTACMTQESALEEA